MDDRNSVLDLVDADDDEIIAPPAGNPLPVTGEIPVTGQIPVTGELPLPASPRQPVTQQPERVITETVEDAMRVFAEQAAAETFPAAPTPIPVPAPQPVPMPEEAPFPMPEETPAPAAEEAPASAPADSAQLAEISEKLAALAAQNTALSEQLTQLSGKYAQISQRIEETNQTVAAHNAIESRMGDELERYKKGLYNSIAEPFIAQLVTVHVSMLRDLKSENNNLAKLPEDASGDLERGKAEVLIDTLKFYIQMLEGALSNCGVEVFYPEIGMPMDQIRYAIIKTVPTDDPQLHSCIASVSSCGYAYNNKVLRPAKVAVYSVNNK